MTRKRSHRQVLRLALAVVAASLLAGCAAPVADSPAATSAPPELRVSAASSLKGVLERTAPAFERDHGVRLVFNFGASGVLEKQIEAGVPADVFASASPTQIAALEERGLVSPSASVTFARNDLVVFVPLDNRAGISGPDDLEKAARLVTGNPDTAPHGTKAREWLKARGVWDTLKPRFVFAENAAQTLDYVARGEVEAGLGFASEATGSERVRVVYTVPADEIAPAEYVAAPLASAERPTLAAAYVAYLRSSATQAALTRAGFLPAPTAP